MWCHRIAISLFAGFMATAAFGQKPDGEIAFDATVELKPAMSFDGSAMMRGTGGVPEQVTLGIRNWIIPNRQRIATFPEQGLLVIQVRAGSLVTIIEGRRQKWGVDQFWTVPPGTTMEIETQQDSVILQVVSLRTTGAGQKVR